MHIDIIKLKTVKEDSVNYQFTKKVGCPEEIYKIAQHIGLWDNTEGDPSPSQIEGRNKRIAHQRGKDKRYEILEA